MNFIFGPSIKADLDTVDIAFISSPTLSPDSAVSTVSVERYVTFNFPHVNQEILFNKSVSVASSGVDIGIFYDGSTLNSWHNPGSPTVYGGFDMGGFVSTRGDFTTNFLNYPIKITGMNVSPAGTWRPIISPGIVWRKHTIRSSEPSGSWLIRSGLSSGDVVYLIYTVPEARYGVRNRFNTENFPGSSIELKVGVESAQSVGPHKIAYEGDIRVLQEIIINGRQRFSGNFDGTGTDDFIRRIDATSKIIEIKGTVFPDDQISLKYLYPAQEYHYSGFADYTSQWYSYNANPEYGHYIVDPNTNTILTSLDTLSIGTVIYVIPSAYVTINTSSVVVSGSFGEANVGQVSLRYTSAFDWAESHFVRHLVGSMVETTSATFDETVESTWGHAVLGKNKYDDLDSISDDSYIIGYPSAMPLGRITMAAPAAARSVNMADVRNRGGGVPMDFPMVAVTSVSGALDTLRGYWDLGIWEGKAYREGGVIEIEIDSSVLSTAPNQPDKFTLEEIHQIIQQRIPPGIEYQLKILDF
jgi:hypothetical protein